MKLIGYRKMQSDNRIEITHSIATRPGRLAFVFRSLGSRNYRLYFAGQSVSLIGTWMQQTAMSWLVYRLTGSPFLLGLTAFCGQVPSFFIAPLAGVFLDRWNRHRLLIVTQTLAMLQALALGALVLTGMVQVWQIILLSLFLGFVISFDMPGRQSFLVEMVGNKSFLGNAIALNSSMVNMARMLGPTVAGIVIATKGEGTCFLINAVTYMAVIISLLMMKLEPRRPLVRRMPVLHGLREGFLYAFNYEPVKFTLILLGLISLAGTPYVYLLPIFAKDILHGGPHTLGFLMGASGVGALTGAVLLATRKSTAGLGRLIALASGTFGAALIGFSLSRIFWLSLLMMFAAGFGMMVQMASGNTVIQTLVDDDKRGRVMSFFAMAFIGMAPFGSLLEGGLAGKIGAPRTLAIGGMLCILGSILFSRHVPMFTRALSSPQSTLAESVQR